MVSQKNDIDKRQSSERSIKIGAGFRHAYRKAKYWKSWVWGITLLLAFFQLLVGINYQNLLKKLPDNLLDYLPGNIDFLVIAVSLLTMLMSTLGRHYLVNKFIGLGSKLQRLHDYEILGLGTKPTILEIKPSLIERFSTKWLKKNLNDRPNLAEWWPNSVSQLPENPGITLCLLSTFKWENELRKKYGILLLVLFVFILAGSFVLMYLMNYLLPDYIVKILVPISPLLALVIDETLINRSAIKTADVTSHEALSLWNKYLSKSVNKEYGKEELNQLNYLWVNYRSSVSPIFDWLYWLTQKTMNGDMIIDVNALVKEYRQMETTQNRS